MVKHLAMAGALMVAVSSHSFADSPLRQLTLNAEISANPIRFVAKRGFVGQIELPTGEAILSLGGASATMSGDTDGWEISGKKGERYVFLKPRQSAANTNLIVVTNRGSYVFDLRVVPEASTQSGIWRLALSHPSPVGQPQLPDSPPTNTNTKYTMQSLTGDADITPSAAWDDGRFTYIRIQPTKELPSIFRVGTGDTESTVNFHMDGDVLVVHEIAKRFVLRLGQQVVGIWNDGFSTDREMAPTANQRTLLEGSGS